MILITGATGFIGRRLAARLAADGHRVRCLVRNPNQRGRLPASAEIVQGDVRTGDGLDRAVDGVRVIYHLAGVTKALDLAEYHDVNVTGTANLLDACARRPPERLVHVSSMAAAHALSVYGKSKLAGEELVRGSALADRAVIIRPPLVYGPGDTDVLRFFRNVASGWVVTVGRPHRIGIIHVDDLVEAFLLAARSDRAAGRTYEAANPDPIRWRELGEAAARAMGRKIRHVNLPVTVAWMIAVFHHTAAKLTGRPTVVCPDKIRDAQQLDWTCDPAPARADLGFEARLSLEQGLAQTLAWYKSSGLLRF